MRHPLKLLLAFALAAAFAAGCGSDDESSSGGDGGETEKAEKADSSSPAAKPKATSARGQMVKCMEDAGFAITHEGEDEATATNYTIEAGDAKKAEIIIHSNREEAERSSIKAGEDKGLNAIPFGRTEFRRSDTATDTEAGVLANCVAEAYVH